MNQDKLEEIARLLGGISDKLDLVVRSLMPPDRIEVRNGGADGSVTINQLGAKPGFKRNCYPPITFVDEAIKAAADSREQARKAEEIARKSKARGLL